MDISKEKFVEIIKEIRKVITSDECAECSCPNIRCELHGDCYNCVRVYRHFGHHVPRCLQFILDKKMTNISQAIEKEMGKRPITPDEHYDYLNSVMDKKMANISQAIEKEMGKRPITPDEHYDYLNSVMPKKDS